MIVVIENREDLELLKQKFPPYIGGNIYLCEKQAYNCVIAVIGFSLVEGEFFVKFRYPDGMLEGDWEDDYASSLLNHLRDNKTFLDYLIEEGLSIKVEEGTSYKTKWYSWKSNFSSKAKNIIRNRLGD